MNYTPLNTALLSETPPTKPHSSPSFPKTKTKGLPVQAIAVISGLLIAVVIMAMSFNILRGKLTRASDSAPRDVLVSSGNSDGVSVSWKTDQKTEALIAYGTSPDKLDRLIPENTTAIDHKLSINEVTNGKSLAPDTTFYFNIKIGDKIYDNNGIPWTFTTKGRHPTALPSARPTNSLTVELPKPSITPSPFPTLASMICGSTDCVEICKKIGVSCSSQDWVRSKCISKVSLAGCTPIQPTVTASPVATPKPIAPTPQPNVSATPKPPSTTDLALLNKTDSDKIRSIVSGNVNRSYKLHLPAAYNRISSIPVIFAFHGAGDDGPGMEQYAGLSALGDKYSVMIVYPNGYKNYWSDGRGMAPGDHEGIDDVQFVSDMISAISKEYPVDSSKIYAAGFSSGGYFVHELACQLTDKISGFVPVSANLSQNIASACNPKTARPVMEIIGDQDIMFNGGTVSSGMTIYSAQDTLQKWKLFEQCQAQAISSQNNLYSFAQYSPCANNAKIKLVIVYGMPHTWPTNQVDAPSIIFQFLGLGS